MSADRTPAPVAVPEGGWQDGDGVVSIGLRTWRRGRNHWRSETGGDASDDHVNDWLARGLIVYVHAPRPEPVAAPLPTEAVERVRADMMNRASRAISGRVDAHRTPDLMKAINALLDAGYRLVPEDDEDTVRRVRALAESWAEADGETVDDHGLTTLTVTNRLGRTLLAALDGPQ